MLPIEDLFACVYVMIDDMVAARIIAIPSRRGPAPACSDAELLAIAEVCHLLGRRSEAAFLAEVARDWAHLFPHLPHQSEANRRIRWLWARLSSCAATWPGRSRPMTASRLTPPRCRPSTLHESGGPDSWTSPDGLHARFGRDAAHAERFFGFRLAIKDGPGRPRRPDLEHRACRRKRARRRQRSAGSRAAAA